MSSKGVKKFKLILASQSPRRREILTSAGYSFVTIPSNSSESFGENLTIEENLDIVVREKVKSVLDQLSPRNQKRSLILAADTIVVCQKQVLGKPKNRTDAARMLRRLSARTHCVMTAICLFVPDQCRAITRIVSTEVGFRKICKSELECYLDSGEPFDKAGSYGIQGLGAQFVNHLKGDLLNVVGLPLTAFESELRKRHWDVIGRRKLFSNKKPNR